MGSIFEEPNVTTWIFEAGEHKILCGICLCRWSKPIPGVISEWYTGYARLPEGLYGRELPDEVRYAILVHGGITWSEHPDYGWDANHYSSPPFTEQEARAETERLALQLIEAAAAAREIAGLRMKITETALLEKMERNVIDALERKFEFIVGGDE